MSQRAPSRSALCLEQVVYWEEDAVSVFELTQICHQSNSLILSAQGEQTRQQWEEQKQKHVQDPPSLRLDVNGLNGYTAMKETMKEMGERPAPRARL